MSQLLNFESLHGNQQEIQPEAARAPNKNQLIITLTDEFKVLNYLSKHKMFAELLCEKKSNGFTYKIAMIDKVKDNISNIAKERQILDLINNPSLESPLFAFQTPKHVYFGFSYFSGGSFYTHHKRRKAELDATIARADDIKEICDTSPSFINESGVQFYAVEIISALEYLHANHICYRNLKLETLHLDSRGHVHLTDFFISKALDQYGGKTSTFCGTAEYLPPEVLHTAPYGFEYDWWTLGILLFEMLEGQTPFYDQNRKLMFYKIINRELFHKSFTSALSIECIRGLLHKDPTTRFRGAQVRETAFIASYLAENGGDLHPPFVPNVTESDTKYIPKMFLDMPIDNSLFETDASWVDAHHFENFDFNFEEIGLK